MISKNYSTLINRKERIYSLSKGGTVLDSGGIDFALMKIVLASLFIGIVIMVLGCVITGINFVNPVGNHFSPTYIIITIVIPMTCGIAPYYITIANYRLYDYLKAYLRPKKIYSHKDAKKGLVYAEVKINTIIKKYF